MLSSTRLIAYVEEFYNPNPAEHDKMLAEGYTHSVCVVDAEDETDLINVRDYKSKDEAQSYADFINSGAYLNA